MISNFSNFVLSICGVALIGVVIELVLPKGKTVKLVKMVVSIFSIFVFMSFISTFLGSEIDFDSYFGSTSNFEIDESFIESINEEKLFALSQEIEKGFKSNGFENVSVKLELIDGTKIKVYVDLSRLVLSGKETNINKYTNIVAIISEYVSVDKEDIIFNE